MTKKTLNDLELEMRSVARGEREPPSAPHENAPRGLLSMIQANLDLMRMIAERRPENVSELAELMGRAQSNVSRSLQELARQNIVRLVREGRSIRPILAASHVDIDLEAGTCRIVPIIEAAE